MSSLGKKFTFFAAALIQNHDIYEDVLDQVPWKLTVKWKVACRWLTVESSQETHL